MPFRVFANPRVGAPGHVVLPAAAFRRAKAEISHWPDYRPTPLRDLPDIAQAAGLDAVRLKDEGGRFGLGSFKPLGGAYAVFALLNAELARTGVVQTLTSADLMLGRYRAATAAITIACATDGNHGRAVAWAARRFGCRAVVFVPEAVSAGRAAAIVAAGAELRRVAGSYDDAVREAARAAQAAGWFVVSDTSWPGYLETPRTVMQGYRLMPDEAMDAWDGLPPTHAFVQGGVGGVAAAVAVQLQARLAEMPALVVVEPECAACLLASAERGAAVTVPGPHPTIMAGLACGEPSLLAWQVLDRAATAFMAIPDAAAIAGMRLLAARGIVAGETGAAGLAGLLLAAADPASRAALALGPDSRVLLFCTEGATDPALYAAHVG